MAKYAGFIGPSYTLPNIRAVNDRVVNWFPSKVESGTGPASYVFECAPGFTYDVRLILGTIGQPIRGTFTLNGTWWAVVDTTLVQSVPSGASQGAATGISNPDDSLVSMAGNGNDPNASQLMIASAGALYVFEVSPSYVGGSLTRIPGISATSVVFINGYFVALDPNTSTAYVSALEDGTTWDLGFAFQRNDSGDKWVTHLVSRKEIWFFGNATTSIYYESDNADTPFIVNPSANITIGTAAPNSVRQLQDGSPIWVGNDFTVRVANGYVPQRVSNFAVEYAISQESDIANADAFTYTEKGHEFYVLSLPNGTSWAYDVTMGLWSQRGSWNGLDYTVVPVRTCLQFGDRTLAGGRTVGVLYDMSQDSVLDVDETLNSLTIPLRRERRAPHIVDELKLAVVDRFQLHLDNGLGEALAQGDLSYASAIGFTPQIMLRWSNNGGQTWSNIRQMSAGRTGEFSARAISRSLGASRDRVFEVVCSDPIPWRLVDAYLRMRDGDQ